MKRFLVLITFFCCCAYGKTQSSTRLSDRLLPVDTIRNQHFRLESITTIPRPICVYPIGMTTRNQYNLSNPVKIADYVSTLGVICRQEIKLDKITPLPVRFRLGSLDYVNWMERKPNAILNQNR